MKKKYITSDQLESALNEQKIQGKKLGEILISNGAITDKQLEEALKEQSNSNKAK